MREKWASEFKDALQFIQRTLDAEKVEWVIVGSFSLCLQGVEVEPHDIDILTNKAGAIKCQDLWHQYVIQPVVWSRTLNYESYFGKFRIEKTIVEVMGEFKVRQGDHWDSLLQRLKEPNRIKFYDMRIPVSSLEDQLQGYTKSTRDKDKKIANLIEQVLKVQVKNREN